MGLHDVCSFCPSRIIYAVRNLLALWHSWQQACMWRENEHRGENYGMSRTTRVQYPISDMIEPVKLRFCILVWSRDRTHLFRFVNGQICQDKSSDAPGQLLWKTCLRHCLVATQPRCFPSSALSVLCFGPWCYCWWFSTASAWLA